MNRAHDSVQAWPRVGGTAVRRVVTHERLASAVDEQRVTGFDGHALRLRDRLQFGGVDRTVRRHVGAAAMSRHVEQHAAGDQTVAERGDVREARSVRVDLPRRVAAVPHAVLIPDVAQGIHVRHRDAVIHETVVIDDRAAGSAIVDPDEVLLGLERTAQ